MTPTTLLTPQQLAELDTELLVSQMDGILIEERYDEILYLLLSQTDFPDAKLTLIGSGPKAWQQKHLKALNYRTS